MAAPIMGNYAVSLMRQEQHLLVPRIGAKRPAMAEYDVLAIAELTRPPETVRIEVRFETKKKGKRMSRGKHTEAQMIEALKQVEGGRSVEEVGRQYGVSKHTIYGWKAKYGGMDVSEAQEVKQLRDENARLKKLVADLSLDKDMLQSVIRKNSLGS
jgi:putative transposase